MIRPSFSWLDFKISLRMLVRYPGLTLVGTVSMAVAIGAGMFAGSGLAALWGLGSMRQVLLLVAANAIMLVLGLAACAVPLRRALRIDPAVALKAEG